MFKSDRCGIETDDCDHSGDRRYSSNQTVAGLKHVTLDSDYVKRLGSNQTVAGLKPKCEDKGISIFTVQIRPLRD